MGHSSHGSKLVKLKLPIKQFSIFSSTPRAGVGAGVAVADPASGVVVAGVVGVGVKKAGPAAAVSVVAEILSISYTTNIFRDPPSPAFVNNHSSSKAHVHG